MITTQQEYIKDILEELRGIAVVHHNESDPELVNIKIDWAGMIKLNEDGALYLTTLRDAGVLVGYSADMLISSLHYKGRIVAFNDAIYMKPDYRHIGITKLLIESSEEFLRSVSDIYFRTINTKVHSKASTLMQSLGYKDHEVSWLKIF